MGPSVKLNVCLIHLSSMHAKHRRWGLQNTEPTPCSSEASLLRRNTAPLWFWRSGCDAALGSSAPGRFLIPAGVTLSNAVSRSLPRSLCLSICQSAVSHCFIPPPPLSAPQSVSLPLTRSTPGASLLICTPHFLPGSLTCTIADIHHRARLLQRQGFLAGRNFFSCLFFFFLSLSLVHLQW